MVQLVVLMIVLAIVYAVKAAVIARGHKGLAEKHASFCWSAIRPQDEATVASWTQEEPEREVRRVHARPAIGLRHVGA